MKKLITEQTLMKAASEAKETNPTRAVSNNQSSFKLYTRKISHIKNFAVHFRHAHQSYIISIGLKFLAGRVVLSRSVK